jgi:hypothetical protein
MPDVDMIPNEYYVHGVGILNQQVTVKIHPGQVKSLRHPAMTNIKPLCENSPTNMMHME